MRLGTGKNRHRITAVLAGLAALTAISACTAAPAEVGGSDLDTARHGQSADWTTWQKNIFGSRFNGAERKINPHTVGDLKLKWAYAFPNIPYSNVGSQPAVQDGVLYVGGPDGKMRALDARTGADKWAYDIRGVTGPVDGESAQLRDGPSVSGNSVYFGDSTGRVYSVNKHTGKLNWATGRMDNHPDTRMTSSPLVFDGTVYIGVSSYEGGFGRDDPDNPSNECCVHRGQMVAINARTGAIEWRYYTMRPAERIGTWPNGKAKYGPSGGSVWSSPVIDPRSRTLYVGTGNNYTGEEGDIDSLLALNIDNGTVRWKHRFVFPDTQTYMCVLHHEVNPWCPGFGTTAKNMDVGATANIIDVRGRTLVTVGQKGGMYHALDARTGEVVWEKRLAEPDLTHNDPGSQGIEWGSAYDGRSLYVSTWRGDPGKVFRLDPATGDIQWETENPTDGCSTGGAANYPDAGCEMAFISAVSVTPGLVYAGSSDGKIRILSARTGRIVWTFDAVRDYQGVNGLPGQGTGISGNGGAVISDGMLYVHAGYHPFYTDGSGGPVLLAFGL